MAQQCITMTTSVMSVVSDDDITTDSDDEFIKDKVHQPARHRNAVARLPPLFNHINLYNNIMLQKFSHD